MQLHLVPRQDKADYLADNKLLPLNDLPSSATILAKTFHQLKHSCLLAPLGFEMHKGMLLVVIELERGALDRSTKVAQYVTSLEFGGLRRWRTAQHLFSTLLVDFKATLTGVSIEVIFYRTVLVTVHEQIELYGLFHELKNCALILLA